MFLVKLLWPQSGASSGDPPRMFSYHAMLTFAGPAYGKNVASGRHLRAINVFGASEASFLNTFTSCTRHLESD